MYWYHLSIHDGNAQWTLFMLSSKPFFRDFTILLTCVAVYYVTSRTKSRHIIFISWESCWQYNFLMISWHIQMYRYTWTWIMDWMALLAFPRTSMQYTNESSASDVYVPSFEGYLLIILSDMTLDDWMKRNYWRNIIIFSPELVIPSLRYTKQRTGTTSCVVCSLKFIYFNVNKKFNVLKVRQNTIHVNKTLKREMYVALINHKLLLNQQNMWNWTIKITSTADGYQCETIINLWILIFNFIIKRL